MTEDLKRVAIMVGMVYQAVALGLTPSSAFLIAGQMLRSIELREGSVGERLRWLEAFMLGMCAVRAGADPQTDRSA